MTKFTLYAFFKILIALLIITTSSVIAQSNNLTTNSKRAAKIYKQALWHYNNNEYKQALKQVNLAIGKDSSFIEAFLIKAELHSALDNTQQSIDAYKQAVAIDPVFFPNAYYYIGVKAASIGNYQEGKDYLSKYLKSGKASTKLRSRASKQLKNCAFGIDAVNNPVPFNPENLGDSVNSIYHDYWPSLSADEQTMVFTRLVPINPDDTAFFHNRQEDFYITTRSAEQWNKATKIEGALNTPQNEGAQALTIDGKYMFFTACNKETGLGQCDIYFAQKKNGYWSRPVNMEVPVNTKYREKQPSISADGKTLYFASNRKGTTGKLDIWKSTLSEQGFWSEPQNLGSIINTEGDETSPFIHPDNTTLYFASDGHTGLGGLDIFMSQRDSVGKWGTPVNLGYPINTHNHEEGLFVNTFGNRAYYSSDRLKSKGRDIYVFELHEKARPLPVSYFKGKVFDAETQKPLYAFFELTNIKKEEVTMESSSSPENGEFLLTLPAGTTFALSVSKPGYLFFSQHFELKDSNNVRKPYIMDIPLESIKVGHKTILRNIFFAFDSYILKQESKTELNKIIDFMKMNPNIKIEISGHTDSIASNTYNKVLSENRAKSVVQYLINHGINKTRLVAKGFGESRPVATNETIAGRAKNRRTEMKILAR